MKIGLTVAEISQCLRFSRWQPSSWVLKTGHFNGQSTVFGQYASPRQISSESVKWLQRYGDLTVFKMAAVQHLGL